MPASCAIFATRFEVDDDAAGVGQAFDEDRLAARRQRTAEILRIVRIDEMAGPAELLERQSELRQRSAVQVARGEELVALLQHGREDQELRGMAGGGGDGGAAAFQAGDAFLQHRDGGIGQARVDVAEIVQVEERRRVVDVVEHVGRGLEDRRDARAGRGIGRGTGMDRAGLEAVADIGRRAATCGLRRTLGGRLGARLRMMPELTPLQDSSPPRRPNSIFGQRFMIDFDAGRLGARRRFVVADAELHPHHLGADRDGVVDDRADLVGGTEHVDHVDLVGDVAQTGVDRFAEQLLAGGAGVHRDDAIALALQILHHEVARPVPVGRCADHRDGAHRRQDPA